MDSGVATRPLADLDAYRERLARFVYHSGTSMKPVFEAAKAAPKRVIYAEGEDERVLRAVQVVVDEGLAYPVLIGRADVIATRIETLGLRLKIGDDLRGRQHPERSALSRAWSPNTTSWDAAAASRRPSPRRRCAAAPR